MVEVATPHAPATFQAVIDTGGPITVVAAGLLDTGGDPVATGTTMMLRLGGATHDVPIYDLTLEVRPPPAITACQPISWRGVVAVLDPWPMQGTAVLLGQAGFLDAFTVTFGPDGFALEPAVTFRARFPWLRLAELGIRPRTSVCPIFCPIYGTTLINTRQHEPAQKP